MEEILNYIDLQIKENKKTPENAYYPLKSAKINEEEEILDAFGFNFYDKKYQKRLG